MGLNHIFNITTCCHYDVTFVRVQNNRTKKEKRPKRIAEKKNVFASRRNIKWKSENTFLSNRKMVRASERNENGFVYSS